MLIINNTVYPVLSDVKAAIIRINKLCKKLKLIFSFFTMLCAMIAKTLLFYQMAKILLWDIILRNKSVPSVWQKSKGAIIKELGRFILTVDPSCRVLGRALMMIHWICKL